MRYWPDAPRGRGGIRALVFGAALLIAPAVLRCQSATEPVYFYFQVDRPAQLLPGMSPPRYPSALRGSDITGSVVVDFVVDTLGRIDLSTFRVRRSTNRLFTVAVRACLPHLRFAPARLRGHAVRQLVFGEFDLRDSSGGR